MTTMNHRYPALQGELEDEYESEYEGELEEELEDEAFLGGLASIAGSLLGEEEYEDEAEGEYELEEEYEFEFEAEAEAESESELEAEFEDEAEEEAEGFVNPVRRVYRDAETMAHLAVRAERAQSESEAEAFIGALVPIAARLIPRAASVLARNAPALIRGATRIARRLRRSPQTRQLVRALPVVLQRTAQSLADQAANGRPIDATTVVRTLGTMTGRVLRSPAAPVRAVDVFDRRWHRRARWNARRRPPVRVVRNRPAYRRPVGRPVNRRVARRVRRR
ncbi:hypothetical protein H5V45_04000 [Nocardioides sp. KIGAM211]|uniref:Uncharacterized protein n=1 Tax=Nocardioides luti TaxID=2761101 RepID=A0A7X0RFR5_9ACTN|nr:hypothetical protein [Nocardioides luti]MBB6626480.1 hypothetical protein [Nocardioides luti]